MRSSIGQEYLQTVLWALVEKAIGFSGMLDRESVAYQVRNRKAADSVERHLHPALLRPAREEVAGEPAHLARQDAEAPTVEMRSEIDVGALVAVPRAHDDPPLEAGGGEGDIEGLRRPRQFESQVEVALVEILGGAGARSTHLDRNPPPRLQPIHGHEPRERESREKRSGHEPDDSVADHQHPFSHHRPRVVDQAHRGLDGWKEHRGLGRLVLGNEVKCLRSREKRTPMRLERENPAPAEFAGDDPADDGVAIGERIPDGSRERRQAVVENRARRELAAVEEELRSGADSRELGLDPDLTVSRLRKVLVSDLDPARRLEVEDARLHSGGQTSPPAITRSSPTRCDRHETRRGKEKR